MTVTKTIHHSYGERIGNSFKGVLVGFGLVLAGIVLLWWNEGRTVHRAKTINVARDNVAETKYDAIQQDTDNKLVHVMGAATTEDVLQDDVFKISVNAIQLIRTAETYQWKEEEHHETHENVGGSEDETITYSYSKVWSEELIDSSGFQESGHTNPSELRYQSQQFFASNVAFGAHKLTKEQIEHVGEPVAYDLKKAQAVKDASAAKAPAPVPVPAANDYDEDGSESAAPAAPAPAPEPANLCGIPNLHLSNNRFYLGNPADAQIGDVRISFTYIPTPQDVTIIAQQLGDTFGPFSTKTGTFDELRNGKMSAEAVFQATEDENKMMAWILRLVGFLAIGIGFSMVFKPLPTLAAVLPFLGHAVGAGTGLIAFVLAAIISLIVIAIAWLFYRPVISICLLAGIVAIVIWYKKAHAAAPGAPVNPPADQQPPQQG